MIISFSNQKGGVGKTSLSLHLSGVIADSDKKVLVVDLDPQGNLSSFFLENIYALDETVRELVLEELDVSRVIKPTEYENIDIVPSNITLSDLDARLAGSDDAQYLLMDMLEDVRATYDYILIDCPPSLSRATKMALVASTHFIVPIECQEWAITGAGQLLAFTDSIKKRANPELELLGFVINKFNRRRRIEAEYNDILRERFPGKVFNTELKNLVVYTEAVTAKKPINFYAPGSEESQAFLELFEEIQKRG